MFELIDMLIVRPITNVLFVIYGFVGDFGLAIILFTILVKVCCWPLVKRQLHQTRLMRKIQPELAEIKKNCNGNRQLESLQMMDLYKRNNIKPFRSMLTLIIQLPIFIALYTAVRVMVLPTSSDNLEIRAYPFVREIDSVDEVITKQQSYLNQVAEYTAKKEENPDAADLVMPEYDFHPKLFGVVDLDPKPGFGSISAFVMMLFALAAALTQIWLSRQQLPSKKSAKSRTFRQIIKEASAGKDPDQAELNQVMTKQMSFMMPLMMFIVMINLPGALVFYYFISNLFTGVQQRYVLNKKTEEMEVAADKRIIKELKNIEEAQVVDDASKHTTLNSRWAKNKNSAKAEEKSGVNITHISAGKHKGHKKKRS